jgi:hypothetical protein
MIDIITAMCQGGVADGGLSAPSYLLCREDHSFTQGAYEPTQRQCAYILARSVDQCFIRASSET